MATTVVAPASVACNFLLGPTFQILFIGEGELQYKAHATILADSQQLASLQKGLQSMSKKVFEVYSELVVP
jgi:hypothetical protein